MIENVSEIEILFSRIEIHHASIILVKKVKTVIKSVCDDYVACICFKNCVQIQNLVILWARFASLQEHLFQTILDNKFNSTNADIEEEFIDAVSMYKMYIVIYRDNDRIWDWRE